MDFTNVSFIVGGVALALVVLLILVFITKYRTAGPDEALIVTGSALGGGKNIINSGDGKKIKIIRGGGTFVLPVFQQAEPLSLLNHKLEVGTRNTYTKQGVPVNVNGVAIIKVGSSIEAISTAAEQYLGKTSDDLQADAKEVLEGHLRAILSSMTVEAIYQDRETFSQNVLKTATPDLKNMGLHIVSFTIKEVSDDNGYLDALGKPQIEEVKKNAIIETANRQKEARIEQALAEKDAQTAELQRDTQIAEAEKEKDMKVQAYKLEQEKARANADQSYYLQEAIARQRVKEEEMKVQIIEREKQIELEEKEILRREKQYDSEVKKKADAERYAKEMAAEAEKVSQILQAEADQFKIEAEANARAEEVRVAGLAKAEIEKAQGLATAEAERAKGTAEADVIRLKGLAEAEAKQKIAEAFEHFGQAAVLDMVVRMLPEYAKQVAAPLGNIDKISVVDMGGNGENSGAGKITGYATNLMTGLQATLTETTGLDLKGLLESYAAKGNIRESVDGLKEELKKGQVPAPKKEGKHLLTQKPQDNETNIDTIIE